MNAPYLFIYHHRRSWREILSRCSSTVRNHLNLLTDYVSKNYGHEYTAADASFGRRKVTVDLMRYLFQPGDTLISKDDGQFRGLVAKSWPDLDGDKKLILAEEEEEDEFDSYGHGPTGSDVGDSDMNSDSKHHTTMLVGAKANRNHAGEKFKSREAKAAAEKITKTFDIEAWKWSFDGDFRRVEGLYSIQLSTNASEISKEWDLHDLDIYPLREEMEQDAPPDEAFLYLAQPQTKGFNLRTKKWLDLNIDQIHPVAWNSLAFDSLVLDRKTKELITALVSKQISSAKSTDVVAGKGNGLILLLHGGPGTGKTLTAEGVAEIAKKPLYRVTCGDVGTKAEEVEKYLESVLYLGRLWDCVVLLDEAEVFLERRSLDDLQRNALVSVFLRVIEYHEGILILTSNRVGTFDEAFRSRIQIAVHYPPLRAYQRLQIWKNFFDRLESFKDGAVNVDELRDNLEELQKIEINGRQIRNAITTARQYAEWKNEVMTYDHLTIALQVAQKFNDYSEKLRGGLTDDQIAEDEGIR
ncbi:hypothetical protein GRF29_44g504717 [Pseudopithomyces chartarum]|uniref:AAA+ ATPase domain-containing protein n=1 Tax=Pseudopithomyces chartarum TaxID=1892770 RepID=A0AAN6M298_9PLEO|nr:hypothetical protein GRF29_44g504717 [Pseudopithomyces chartarum]